MLLRLVRVAVADEVVLAAADGGPKQLRVMAVGQRDLSPADSEFPQEAVERMPALFAGGAQLVGLHFVDVSQDEMGRPLGDEPWYGRRTDIAAVQQRLDGELLEDAQRGQRAMRVPVGIAD